MHLLVTDKVINLYLRNRKSIAGALPGTGTFTCLIWSLVHPDFKEYFIRYS
jgi:hypothetical protein